jgi:O-antigen ligase
LGATLVAVARGSYIGGLALTPWLIAPVNALFALGFLSWLLGGRAGVTLRELGQEPLVRVFATGFALLTVAALAASLSSSLSSSVLSEEGLPALLKYRELLLSIPIVALFRDEVWRERALLAFGLSGFAMVLVSTAQWLGLATSPRGPTEGALVLRHGITHSTVIATLALVAWLQASRCVATGSPLRAALWRFVSLAAATNVLLMVPGRTGYLILAAGLVYFGFRRFRLRGVVAGLLAVALVGAGAYRVSDTMRARVDMAVAETLRFAEGEVAPTSAGSRLLFWESTIELVREHPWLGTGLGSWHAKVAAEMSAAQRERMLLGHEHPHNELLHVAAQTGLVGAALYLAGLLVIARRATRLRPDAGLLGAALAAYAAGALVNSFLWDSVEGQLFAALAALAVAGAAGGAARIGSHSGMSR